MGFFLWLFKGFVLRSVSHHVQSSCGGLKYMKLAGSSRLGPSES